MLLKNRLENIKHKKETGKNGNDELFENDAIKYLLELTRIGAKFGVKLSSPLSREMYFILKFQELV